VKSFLLQELTRLILPFSLLMAVSLLIKGHDLPGGGFVAGLAVAVAGILSFTAYGLESFQNGLRVPPEKFALLGGLMILCSLLVPLLLGQAPLTQAHAHLGADPISVELHSALFFDIGVALCVGGGLASAAQANWATTQTEKEDM
jgi:multisubunit Na+/H+ antiporter MnhB subunit